jgi:hypothetical protein
MKRRISLITAIAAVAAISSLFFGFSAAADGGTGTPLEGPSIALEGPSDAAPNPTLNPLGFSDCNPYNALCLWHDGGYSGTFWVEKEDNHQVNAWYELGDANDNVSSLYNNRSKATYIDKDWPPTGEIECLPQQFAISALGNGTWHWPDGSSMNDSITSFNLLSVALCP